ncbi:hydrogenase maturation protease [Methylocapsa aurea]|uniref:hydrogenase maturation protease n=1 Tax=Methylocapsa aurea TaxID=663610 RepID=UPI000560D8F0|nr:hydrogenase maturation protease [Methylocapsa aurea]
MSRILVACVGNIFLGDDGFGAAVAQALARRRLPAGVSVVDYGIRGVDLTYALLEDYAYVVLVDAVRRGGRPGSVYLIEPERLAGDPAPEDLLMSPHDLDPAKVLRLAAAMGSGCRRVFLIGCEPLRFGGEEEGFAGEGLLELSPPVAAAVDIGVAMVEDVIGKLLEAERVP